MQEFRRNDTKFYQLKASLMGGCRLGEGRKVGPVSSSELGFRMKQRILDESGHLLNLHLSRPPHFQGPYDGKRAMIMTRLISDLAWSSSMSDRKTRPSFFKATCALALEARSVENSSDFSMKIELVLIFRPSTAFAPNSLSNSRLMRLENSYRGWERASAGSRNRDLHCL
jgi:hypothetical protein